MGVFSKIAQAKVSQKSDNIRDGQYLFEVRNLIYKDMQGGMTFVAELGVVEGKSKGDKNAETGEPVEPNAVGSTVGYVQPLNAFAAAPNNIKAFICALLDANPDTVSEVEFEKTCEELFGAVPSGKGGATFQDKDQQPCRGMLIKGATYQSKVKSGANAGKIFTYCQFSHVAQTPEEIKARRAAQG